jgi:hypothetical protein
VRFEPKSKSESENTNKGNQNIEIKDDEMRRRIRTFPLRREKTVRKKLGCGIRKKENGALFEAVRSSPAIAA